MEKSIKKTGNTRKENQRRKGSTVLHRGGDSEKERKYGMTQRSGWGDTMWMRELHISE